MQRTWGIAYAANLHPRQTSTHCPLLTLCVPSLNPTMGGYLLGWQLRQRWKVMWVGGGFCSKFSSRHDASPTCPLYNSLIYFSLQIFISLFSHFPTLNVMYVCKLLIVLSNNTCSLEVPVLVLYNIVF